MKALRFDSVGGASGDMVLGALVDLGADPSTIEAAADALGAGAVRIEAEKVRDHGLEGTRVRVHTGGAHGHDAPHDPHAAHGHGPHRAWREIRSRIENAALARPVKE